MWKRWIGYRELVGELIMHTDNKISVIVVAQPPLHLFLCAYK